MTARARTPCRAPVRVAPHRALALAVDAQGDLAVVAAQPVRARLPEYQDLGPRLALRYPGERFAAQAAARGAGEGHRPGMPPARRQRRRAEGVDEAESSLDGPRGQGRGEPRVMERGLVPRGRDAGAAAARRLGRRRPMGLKK